MSLVTYEPWRLLHRFRSDLDRLETAGFGQNNRPWTPAVDIHEFSDRYQLELDIPGVNPANIDVSADNGVLTISGERSRPEFETEADASRVERGFGEFRRRFDLPELADTDKIDAKASQGVLTIRIAKQAQVEPRRITVEAA